MNYKLITAGTAGRACGLVEFAPGYEAGSRSVFSRAVVHQDSLLNRRRMLSLYVFRDNPNVYIIQLHNKH